MEVAQTAYAQLTIYLPCWSHRDWSADHTEGEAREEGLLQLVLYAFDCNFHWKEVLKAHIVLQKRRFFLLETHSLCLEGILEMSLPAAIGYSCFQRNRTSCLPDARK